MMKAAQLVEKKLGLLKSGGGPHTAFRPIGHYRKQKQLQAMMVHDDDDSLVEASTDSDSEVMGKGVELGVMAELPINSVVGLTKPYTMQLRGKLND
ncbi:hypothetical protein PanWU01x14_099160 [Parasponia andersonii]|uniref:Uncharacterized protein n=1 Tax=Parasponia andersonii TaxID=3476 RepID=A0A2P5D3P1_PARAD|nr:hypothetical protein PanWU01x14_099160 [Parasponia andersonii]